MRRRVERWLGCVGERRRSRANRRVDLASGRGRGCRPGLVLRPGESPEAGIVRSRSPIRTTRRVHRASMCSMHNRLRLRAPRTLRSSIPDSLPLLTTRRLPSAPDPLLPRSSSRGRRPAYAVKLPRAQSNMVRRDGARRSNHRCQVDSEIGEPHGCGGSSSPSSAARS